jgi:aspartate aminotransferase-like enzyme
MRSTDMGDRCLVCVNGYFGDRFVEMCKRRGCVTDVITAEVGHSVSEEQIRTHLAQAQSEGKVKIVLFGI